VGSTSKLTCELCGSPVGAGPAIAAVEVLVERDAMGNVITARDGYNVVFHEHCWSDLRSRRVYSARSYRRPRPTP
jgi:hypothetical protein